MTGQRDGGANWPRWVTGKGIGTNGFGVPQTQVFEDTADDGGIVDDSDDSDDAHGMTTLGALQGVDFIRLHGCRR